MVQSLQLGRSSRRRCGSIRHETYFMARLIVESPKGKVYENSLVGSMIEPELRRMRADFQGPDRLDRRQESEMPKLCAHRRSSRSVHPHQENYLTAKISPPLFFFFSRLYL